MGKTGLGGQKGMKVGKAMGGLKALKPQTDNTNYVKGTVKGTTAGKTPKTTPGVSSKGVGKNLKLK